ncbi:MAG: ABC transporter ATP-binding protein [Rhizobiaceae bacterium]
MTLLSVSHLDVALRGTPVLRDVSLAVGPGEFVGLIGPNGAGKTTLLRAVLGLVDASGAVQLGDRRLASLGERERALRVSYLPQERDIAWAVAAEAIVTLGRAPHRKPYAGLTPEDCEAIDRAFSRMDAEHLRMRIATQLSGGERARVLIARALAQEAPLLLADEPVAGLDPAHQIGLMRLFAQLAVEGRSVVASMHDLTLAARWCSRIVLLADGAIAADGTPAEVLTSARLRAVYGIDALVGEHEGRPLVQPLDIATGSTPAQESDR